MLLRSGGGGVPGRAEPRYFGPSGDTGSAMSHTAAGARITDATRDKHAASMTPRGPMQSAHGAIPNQYIMNQSLRRKLGGWPAEHAARAAQAACGNTWANQERDREQPAHTSLASVRDVLDHAAASLPPRFASQAERLGATTGLQAKLAALERSNVWEPPVPTEADGITPIDYNPEVPRHLWTQRRLDALRAVPMPTATDQDRIEQRGAVQVEGREEWGVAMHRPDAAHMSSAVDALHATAPSSVHALMIRSDDGRGPDVTGDWSVPAIGALPAAVPHYSSLAGAMQASAGAGGAPGAALTQMMFEVLQAGADAEALGGWAAAGTSGALATHAHLVVGDGQGEWADAPASAAHVLAAHRAVNATSAGLLEHDGHPADAWAAHGDDRLWAGAMHLQGPGGHVHDGAVRDLYVPPDAAHATTATLGAAFLTAVQMAASMGESQGYAPTPLPAAFMTPTADQIYTAGVRMLQLVSAATSEAPDARMTPSLAPLAALRGTPHFAGAPPLPPEVVALHAALADVATRHPAGLPTAMALHAQQPLAQAAVARALAALQARAAAAAALDAAFSPTEIAARPSLSPLVSRAVGTAAVGSSYESAVGGLLLHTLGLGGGGGGGTLSSAVGGGVATAAWLPPAALHGPEADLHAGSAADLGRAVLAGLLRDGRSQYARQPSAYIPSMSGGPVPEHGWTALEMEPTPANSGFVVAPPVGTWRGQALAPASRVDDEFSAAAGMLTARHEGRRAVTHPPGSGMLSRVAPASVTLFNSGIFA